MVFFMRKVLISRFYGIVIKMLYEAGGSITNPMFMLNMENMRHRLALMERF